MKMFQLQQIRQQVCKTQDLKRMIYTLLPQARNVILHGRAKYRTRPIPIVMTNRPTCIPHHHHGEKIVSAMPLMKYPIQLPGILYRVVTVLRL